MSPVAQPEPQNPRKGRDFSLVVFLVSALVISTLASIFWFTPIRGHSFMGDDLQIITRNHAGSYFTAFFKDVLSAPDDKFRPVANPAIGLAIRSCGLDFDCYENANLVMYILNGVLFAFIVYQFTRKWALAGLLAIFVYTFSRFSPFFYVQVFGIMENLGLTFVLLYALAVGQFLRSQKEGWFWLALLSTILATGAHERFIILALPLVLLPFLNGVKENLWLKVGRIAGVILFPSGYVAFRAFVLHIPIFVGTAHTLITETFNIANAFIFILKGLVNLVGVNATYTEMGGINFWSAGRMAILLPVVVVTALLMIFWLYIRGTTWRAHLASTDNRINLMYAVTILSLIAISSVTIRLEHKWLLSPFLLFLLIIFNLISTYRSQTVKIVALGLIVGLMVVNNVYYRKYEDNMYFLTGLRIADAARENVLDHYSIDELSHRDIMVVTHGDPALEDWIFLHNYFVDLYVSRDHSPTIYVNDYSDIQSAARPGSDPIIIDVQGLTAREIIFQANQ
jgi:hypothetical protein